MLLSLLPKLSFIAAFLAAFAAPSVVNPNTELRHDKKNHQFSIVIGPLDLQGTGAADTAAAPAHVHGGPPGSAPPASAMPAHSHAAPAAAQQEAAGMHSHSGGVYPPVTEVQVPADGYLSGFTVRLFDNHGMEVPQDLIHHLNFIDPENRELFAPISQRMLAVGKETGSYSFPRMLFGYPVKRGQTMVVAAMLHNPHPEDYHGVKVEVTFEYTPTYRPWPLFRVYPFQLDVLFPTGDKSFDLPPGRTERSYEATPAIDARIIALSGHVHEYATSLTLTNVTTNKVIWEGKPTVNAEGKVASMPVTSFANTWGVRLRKDHKYRVTVIYQNPTSDTLTAGGMGVIGGVVLPARKTKWPKADRADTTYGIDRRHYMRQTSGASG